MIACFHQSPVLFRQFFAGNVFLCFFVTYLMQIGINSMIKKQITKHYEKATNKTRGGKRE
jgi:hypothetical protein